jgi:hypothetical protein
VGQVGDSTYHALVPSDAQFATESAKDIPGGFAMLRNSGISEIEVVVDGDEITIRTDRGDTTTRSVTERVVVQDSEGSGPFKAEKEVLVLGSDPLIVGDLIITAPVIWPGTFEGSPVITVKSQTDDDRGPGVSCGAEEACLLLSSGIDPIGRYEDANNPSLNENPIATIEVSDDSVEFTLHSGEVFKMGRTDETTTNACGLSETAAWDVPAAVGLAMEDPVLLQASCPSTAGDNYLIIFERRAIPVLAPLGPEFGGEWCLPGSKCLLFVPTG